MASSLGDDGVAALLAAEGDQLVGQRQRRLVLAQAHARQAELVDQLGAGGGRLVLRLALQLEQLGQRLVGHEAALFADLGQLAVHRRLRAGQRRQQHACRRQPAQS
ncbi:hypothetical protein [Rugamonas sp. DEMB1]|uniref:hypothetical protein n=1 Tax=Rugamonas sp. DEMB1 TaxID=3039386 RepID=UPI002448923B|nr:hypothetical protein [Rugamonas sp. DEMB1]WGG51490.1 hypothetical protein QC826_04315 [Rugamonas sp. DEMB1]